MEILRVLALLKTCPVQQKRAHGENDLKRSFNLFLFKRSSVTSQSNRPSYSGQANCIKLLTIREKSMAPCKILPIRGRTASSAQNHTNRSPYNPSNRTSEKQVLRHFRLAAEGAAWIAWPFFLYHRLPGQHSILRQLPHEIFDF